MNSFFVRAAFLSMAMLGGLVACSGGGSKSAPPANITAPAITSQPQPVAVAEGHTASFDVTATGTAPLTYQWRKDGAVISGATTASYTTPVTTLADTGAVFTVIVSNAAGDATSSGATLSVSAQPAGSVLVYTLAGWFARGGAANGSGSAATFGGPLGIAVDGNGNIYVADSSTYRIRKITPTGVVSTFAGGNIDGSAGYGNANGVGLRAAFRTPAGLVIDGAGVLYMADTENHLIRKITPAGEVTTLAGAGTAGYVNDSGINARFTRPRGLALDASGNVYVADTGNNRIRKITPAGQVSNVAGSGAAGSANGPSAQASFSSPTGVAVDAVGNVYVADNGNASVRKITPAGEVSTLVSSVGVWGVDVDASNNLYVAGYDKILKVTPQGTVSTVAGSNSGFWDGAATIARFKNPNAVDVDAAGNIYVADSENNSIRLITAGNHTSHTVGGTLSGMGVGGLALVLYSAARIDSPGGNINDATGSGSSQELLLLSNGSFTFPGVFASGNSYAVAVRTQPPGQLCKVSDASGSIIVTNIRNISVACSASPGAPSSGSVVVSTLAGGGGGGDATGTEAGFGTYLGSLMGVAADASGNVFTVEGYFDSSHVRKVSPAGVVSSVAGGGSAVYADGVGSQVYFRVPQGIALDGSGNIYVADGGGHLIRKVTPAGVVTTLAGAGGSPGYVDATGPAARFNSPWGIAADAAGNIYVADTANSAIRIIYPDGRVSTFAGSGSAGYADGTGTAASFRGARGVAVDSSGNVYVADTGNHVIRKITPAREVTTLAGAAGSTGSANGNGAFARFYSPNGVAVDASGVVYVVDGRNSLVRRITPAGDVTTLAGTLNPISCDPINGAGPAATFCTMPGVTVDASGTVYVADGAHNSSSSGRDLVRKITQ